MVVKENPPHNWTEITTDWQYTSHALLLFMAAALLALAAFYAWRRRSTPGATALAVLMAAGVVWGVAYGASLSVADPAIRLFCGEIKYLGIVAAPPAWLAFALQYTGREGWATRRVLALLAAEPLVSLVLIFTNGAHGLFWSSRGPGATGPFPVIESVYGSWFWVHLSYSYLLLLVGTFFLVQTLFSSAYLYSGQRMALTVGASVPWAGNALTISGLLPADSPNPAPLAFAAAGVVFAWTLFRYGPLDVVSIARDAVVEGMGDGVIVLDARDRVVDLNPSAQRILGCPFSEVVGRPVARIMPDQAALLIERHRGSEEAHGEATLGNGSAPPRDYDLALSSLRTQNGTRRAGRLISLRDVTERKKAEETLRESEQRFRAIFEGAAVGTALVDLKQGRLVSSNPALREMLGYREEELLGMRSADLTHPDDAAHNRVLFEELLAGERESYQAEKRCLRKDGGILWGHLTVSLTRDADGEPRFLILMVENITERKALEQRLVQQALHDALTGLPNRALFLNRLEHALSRAERRASKVAVLFMDLDNFKYINDSLGHRAGDRLLLAVAERLKTCLRPEGMVARFGGDEFAVLLEGIEGTSEAKRAAERIVEKLRAPFALDGQETFVTPSIGITLNGSKREELPEDLLRAADVAMYRAKEEGKARHQLFDPGMEAQVVERLELENGLRRALERDELVVRYQPLLSLKTGQVVGIEALLRWQHPERGLLAPDEFVPVAEENGLIVPIGRRVLHEACRQAKEWHECYPHHASPLHMGVNLSAKQLGHPDLVGDVEEVLLETGLDPQRLTLEVTESSLIESRGRPIGALQELRDLGVQLALDDFGTGYSSLSYLKRLPVDLLKIDRSFVERIGEDGEDEVLVSGIVYVASGLGLSVAAEGVETPEQLARVKSLGCNLAQGDYLSEPLPPEAVEELLGLPPE